MPFSYSIKDGIVVVAWQGTISKADLVELGQTMPKVGRSLGFAPDVLHTFGAVSGHDFQPIFAYAYSLMQKRVQIPNPVRAAVVTASAEGRALAKVFMTLNRAKNLEMEIFDDEAAARAWIAAKPKGGN